MSDEEVLEVASPTTSTLLPPTLLKTSTIQLEELSATNSPPKRQRDAWLDLVIGKGIEAIGLSVKDSSLDGVRAATKAILMTSPKTYETNTLSELAFYSKWQNTVQRTFELMLKSDTETIPPAPITFAMYILVHVVGLHTASDAYWALAETILINQRMRVIVQVYQKEDPDIYYTLNLPIRRFLTDVVRRKAVPQRFRPDGWSPDNLEKYKYTKEDEYTDESESSQTETPSKKPTKSSGKVRKTPDRASTAEPRLDERTDRAQLYNQLPSQKPATAQ